MMSVLRTSVAGRIGHFLNFRKTSLTLIYLPLASELGRVWVRTRVSSKSSQAATRTWPQAQFIRLISESVALTSTTHRACVEAARAIDTVDTFALCH